MKRFRYKAKDKQGKTITGEVEAASEAHAVKLIHNKEFFVVSITSARVSQLDLVSRFRNRITRGDITNFTRQMATMINAGLPITESLLILRTQSKTAFQKVIAKVMADIEGGEPLSTSLARYPTLFSPTYIALIRSGEIGGVLDKVLARLADNLEKEQEFKAKIKGALIYPSVIISGMILVALIMLIFVIPRLLTLYSELDVELPISTKILIAVSGFFEKFWLLVIGAVVSAAYGFRFYKKTEAGRLNIDQTLLKLPLFGELIRQVILTEITRTLSLMVGAGVSILEALNVAAKIVKNKIISEAISDTEDMVRKGFPVAYSIARHPEAFPFLLSQMVAVGEETGKMGEVLQKVSNIYEIESDQKIKGLTSTIEPLFLIILGIGVAFLIISILLPIYNLTSSL